LKTVVLDASVAAKWTFPLSTEPLLAEANRLLAEYLSDRLQFIVPDLFWAEIGSVLRKAVLQRKTSEMEAQLALAAMLARNFPTVPSSTIVEDAVSIALRFDRSVYDSIYVALAVASRTELVTADERLANALASRFPVKWLGLF